MLINVYLYIIPTLPVCQQQMQIKFTNIYEKVEIFQFENERLGFYNRYIDNNLIIQEDWRQFL